MFERLRATVRRRGGAVDHAQTRDERLQQQGDFFRGANIQTDPWKEDPRDSAFVDEGRPKS